MRAIAIFLSTTLATSLFASDDAPFDIDADKLLELFLTAVAEQLPDIPQELLALNHGIIVTCWSTQPGERMAIDEEFRPCSASIQFELNSGHATSRYRDRDGNCKVHRGIEVVSASLDSDGYIQAGSRVNPQNPEAVLPCEEDAVVPPEKASIGQGEQAFSVDSKQLLAISLAAVNQSHPDIPAEALFLSSVIYLWCKPDSRDKGVPGIHAKLNPCYAKLPFQNWSDITEWPSVNADGECTSTTRIGNVKVMITQNGNVSVSDSGWGETDPEVVECTEEFYESLDSRT